MNMNTLRNRRAVVPAATLAALLLAGCGGREGAASPGSIETPSAASGSSSETVAPATSTAAGAVAVRGTLRFDSHGSDVRKGGSGIIFTYADPSETGRGTENAQFPNGKEVDAVCELRGRQINRIPEQGEEPGGSDRWVQIAPERRDDPSFANLAYADVVAGAPLPACQ